MREIMGKRRLLAVLVVMMLLAPMGQFAAAEVFATPSVGTLDDEQPPGWQFVPAGNPVITVCLDGETIEDTIGNISALVWLPIHPADGGVLIDWNHAPEEVSSGPCATDPTDPGGIEAIIAAIIAILIQILGSPGN